MKEMLSNVVRPRQSYVQIKEKGAITERKKEILTILLLMLSAFLSLNH